MTKQQLITEAEKEMQTLKVSTVWQEIENENAYYLEISNDKNAFITTDLLKKIYTVVTGEKAAFRTQDTVEPARKVPAAADLDHYLMHFVSQMQISRQMFHPIEYAAICHKRILEVCPFVKHNEEVADFVLNFLLVQSGYITVALSKVEPARYEEALRIAQHPSSPDVDALISYIAECLIGRAKALLNK